MFHHVERQTLSNLLRFGRAKKTSTPILKKRVERSGDFARLLQGRQKKNASELMTGAMEKNGKIKERYIQDAPAIVPQGCMRQTILPFN